MLPDGGHEHGDALGGGNTGGVGGLHGRRILAGKHSPAVNSLALGEHVRVGPPRRLLRAQPLQGRAFRGGGVLAQQLDQ